MGGGRRSRRWNILEGVEVVDNMVADQRTAAKGPPVHHSDAERRMQVFVLRQLLKDDSSQLAKGTDTIQPHSEEKRLLPAQWHRPMR